MPFMDLDDVRLHYTVQGSNGPWVTLLHGGLVDMTSFADLATRLAETMRVLTFDLRGYGQSVTRDGDLSLAASARDAIHLFDHLGITSSTVFGFSMGGMVAQCIALDRPERLDGLVLASTGSRSGPEKSEIFRARAERIESHGLAAEREEHVARAFSASWLRDNVDQFHDYADQVLANDPAVVAATMRSIADFDVTDALSQVDLPVLVLAGEFDEGFGPAVAMETAARLQNVVVHVVTGAGHTIHLERPQEIAREINEFVRDRAFRSSRVPTDNFRGA